MGAHSVTFSCLPAMARDGELIQTQYFFHYRDTICHPNSSYMTTKLYETSACGCDNNTIFQKRAIFDSRRMSRTLAWQHTSLHNYRVKYYDYCKVVQMYSMRLVCITGYWLNFSCNNKPFSVSWFSLSESLSSKLSTSASATRKSRSSVRLWSSSLSR